MHFEVSKQEALFLKAQVERRLAEIDDELVHTDARDLQSALAADLERLRSLAHRLERLLDTAEVAG